MDVFIELYNTPNADYKTFSNDNNKKDDFKCTAVKRIQQNTPLSNLYFSIEILKIYKQKLEKVYMIEVMVNF